MDCVTLYVNTIKLITTSKGSLCYGSTIKGKVIAKTESHTLVRLQNKLVIRIANTDILRILNHAQDG
jgi:hypothetical protein